MPSLYSLKSPFDIVSKLDEGKTEAWSFKNRLTYNPNKTPFNNCRTLMMMMMMMMMNLGTLSYQLRPLSTTTPFDLPHLLPDIKFGGPKVWHLFGCMRMMRVFKKNEILDFALALFCTLRRFIWESVLHQQKWVLKQTRHRQILVSGGGFPNYAKVSPWSPGVFL